MEKFVIIVERENGTTDKWYYKSDWAACVVARDIALIEKKVYVVDTTTGEVLYG